MVEILEYLKNTPAYRIKSDLTYYMQKGYFLVLSYYNDNHVCFVLVNRSNIMYNANILESAAGEQ